MNIPDVIQSFFDLGLADVWLPFALVLMVVLIGLSRVSFLNKRLRTTIAIAVASITVYAHAAGLTSRCLDPVIIIDEAIPTIGYVAIGLVIFFAVVGLIGLGRGIIRAMLDWGVIAMIGVVAYVGLSAAGPDCFPFQISYLPINELFLGGVILLFGWLIMRGGGAGRAPDLDMY